MELLMTPCCNQPGSLQRIPMSTSVSCCFLLSIIYVASLYIWNYEHARDHPSTIKRRFCSVFVVMGIAPIFVYKFSTPKLLENEGFGKILGIKTQGLALATATPIVLTSVLFLGPICAQFQSNSLCTLTVNNCLDSFANILWVRNHIVAPLSEEFVFRACMMPLILQSFSPVTAVFITPLFFGTAHIHHIVEHLKMGVDLRSAIIITCFQLSYTTLFGFYSSFLFARTGHFMAPFLAHAFCNHMGFPDLQNLWQQNLWKRVLLIICYIAGLITWIFLLPLFTRPDFYGNTLYWNF